MLSAAQELQYASATQSQCLHFEFTMVKALEEE